MKCPKCLSIMPAEAKFCPRCGAGAAGVDRDEAAGRRGLETKAPLPIFGWVFVLSIVAAPLLAALGIWAEVSILLYAGIGLGILVLLVLLLGLVT